MSREVLLDTSILYAAADRDERHHDAAVAALEMVRLERLRPVTTDLILAELHSLALRRLGPAPALELIERTMASAVLEIQPTSVERLAEAVALLRSRPGRTYSLADAVTFVLMRERGTQTALTLDTDFTAEGFTVIPPPMTEHRLTVGNVCYPT